MPEDVVGASISVNLEGIEGNVSGDSGSKEILTKILDELKRMNTESSRREKETKSGLFDALLNKSKIGGAITAGANVIAGAGLAQNALGDLSQSFAAITDVETGERKIAEINEITGNIVDILTEKEAKDRDILDENGNIRRELRVQKLSQEEMNDSLDSQKDNVIITKNVLDDILLEIEKQKLADKRITAAKEEYAKQMEELAGMTPTETSGDYFGGDTTNLPTYKPPRPTTLTSSQMPMSGDFFGGDTSGINRAELVKDAFDLAKKTFNIRDIFPEGLFLYNMR